VIGGILREPDDDQREALLSALDPAAAICPAHGVDADACVLAAQRVSNWGRHVVGHNYWELGGAGDKGFVTLLTLRPRADGQGGGFDAVERHIAKFSSPTRAILAYCEAAQRRR